MTVIANDLLRAVIKDRDVCLAFIKQVDSIKEQLELLCISYSKWAQIKKAHDIKLERGYRKATAVSLDKRARVRSKIMSVEEYTKKFGETP